MILRPIQCGIALNHMPVCADQGKAARSVEFAGIVKESEDKLGIYFFCFFCSFR